MKNFRDKNGNIMAEGVFEDNDIKLNPTMSGSEPEATGIEFKGQKFKFAGGGSDGGVTTIKAGQKIRIDLSQYPNYFIESDDDFHEGSEGLFLRYRVTVVNGPYVCLPDYTENFSATTIVPDNDGENSYLISMIINTSHTQILCECGMINTTTWVDYDSLMPATVVYESTTPITYDSESKEIDPEVLAQLPTIEVSVTEELVGKIAVAFGQCVPCEIVD